MPNAATFDLVLFGATGDLALRKLLPALYRRCVAGQISKDSALIGVARAPLDRAAFVAMVEEHCRKQLGAEFHAEKWQTFIALLNYVELDVTNEEHYSRLKEQLQRDNVTRIFFVSTAPTLFTAVCKNLGKHSLATPLARIVLEKPLGQDQASADAINREVAAIFSEQQIYRIDHYLGKEAVQNLMALRFGNMLFEPLWRRGRIRHVQITVAETIGVEGRGSFYDQTGALRDMVQNHLLQLLCIIAMEPPTNSNADAVRDEKLKVLRALRPLAGREAIENTVRGQYRAGASDGGAVIGYLEEPGIAPNSQTETFVALKVEINTWRWAGVPFYLRTGKRLQQRTAEIVVTFEDVPYSIFDGTKNTQSPNKLIIRLQPDESIILTILAKKPGETMKLKPVNLRLDLSSTFKTRPLDAYERLLMDVVHGNLTLFMRRDELDSAWQWIDPIRAAWNENEEPPKSYVAGSSGPAASSALLGRDGFAWNDEG